jgi:hypothetical protein
MTRQRIATLVLNSAVLSLCGMHELYAAELSVSLNQK